MDGYAGPQRGQVRGTVDVLRDEVRSSVRSYFAPVGLVAASAGRVIRELRARLRGKPPGQKVDPAQAR